MKDRVLTALRPTLQQHPSDILRFVHASSDQIVVRRRLHSPAHQSLFVQSPSDPDSALLLMALTRAGPLPVETPGEFSKNQLPLVYSGTMEKTFSPCVPYFTYTQIGNI